MMMIRLVLIGLLVALIVCGGLYLITPGHLPRTEVPWLNGRVIGPTSSWSYTTAQYVTVTPRPFGRLRATLHQFLYH